ncbi:MAG: hypothetical protein R3213_13180 [Flavobacteriaceae bacterium]|nr:hypothetical protein [Flavobacteriaceae bacterium]
MKAATISEIKKELKFRSEEETTNLVLRLARFKKENKELLTYLLFESDQEENYIQSIKDEADIAFAEINRSNYYFIKKSVRKILRNLKKYSRYSNRPDTEVELLIYFCDKLKELNPSIFRNRTLTNLYERQLSLIERRTAKLHEDLQFEYNAKIEELTRH